MMSSVKVVCENCLAVSPYPSIETSLEAHEPELTLLHDCNNETWHYADIGADIREREN